MSKVIAVYLTVLLAAACSIATQEQFYRDRREEYSRHVYSCQRCTRLDAPLCDEGERLRVAAREDDGLIDPALDKPTTKVFPVVE